MSILGAIGKVVGFQSSYKPTTYDIDQDAFSDPNLNTNLNAYQAALKARQAQGVPQAGGPPVSLYASPPSAGTSSGSTGQPIRQGSVGVSSTTRQQAAGSTPGAAPAPQPFGTAAGVAPVGTNNTAQQNFLNQLYLRATGQQKGLGTQLANQATDQAVALAKAETAGSRGNVGMAQRNALQAAQTAKLQGNQQAINTAITEQENAQNAGGALATSGRGQDIDTANLAQQNQQFNAGQVQQNAQFNANLQQQAQNQIDQMTQYYTSLGYNEEQAAYAAAQAYQQLNLQQNEANNATAAGISTANSGGITSMINSGIGAAKAGAAG